MIHCVECQPVAKRENENAIAIIDRPGDVDLIIDEIVVAFRDTSKRDTIKLVCAHPSDQLNVFFHTRPSTVPDIDLQVFHSHCGNSLLSRSC